MNDEQVEDLFDRPGRVLPSTSERLKGLISLFWMVTVEFSHECSWADSSEPVFGERSSREMAEVVRHDRVAASRDRQTRYVLVLLMDADNRNGFRVRFKEEGVGEVRHRGDGVGTETFGGDVWVVGEDVPFEFFEDFLAPSQFECIEAGEGQEEVTE